MTEFLIGADPELFVRDTDGKLVSAYGMIPGTKANPYQVDCGAVQVDGMALEFNINPAKTFKEFNNNITTVLAQLKEMIPNGYSFDFSPVAQFGQEYIDAQPDAARELGCDPDFNAYTGNVNPKPDASQGFRTASGHIHVGWTSGQDISNLEHIEACQMVAKQLDIGLYVPSLVWDRDTIRSKMYGAPGAYRPKHYGVEYRTLSNAWVDNEDLRKIVFHCTMGSVGPLLEGKQFWDYYSVEDYRNVFLRGGHGDINYYAKDIVRRRITSSSSAVAKLINEAYERMQNPNGVESSKNRLVSGPMYSFDEIVEFADEAV